QAEDGIRDFHVTGVQTCALPISAVEGRLVVHGEALRIAEDAGAMLDDGELVVVRTVAAEGRSRAHLGGRSVPVGVLAEMGSELRSEERRVGKECGARRGADAPHV